MEHTAIRNIYPNAVTIRGSEAFDADDNPIVLNATLVQNETDRLQAEYDAQDYARKREAAYPATKDFMEAYTEKEIGGDTTKWDAYVINYNKTRSDNPK